MMHQSDEQLNIANLERFFLNRLTRFARLASEADASQIPQWRRLARASTLSAYRDCATLGLEREAREILARTFGRQTVSA
jgi:hypothetical protein